MSQTKDVTENTETEYWTEDADGRGYCSVFSLEDALRGHFHDMKATDPLGPIVNVKIITRVIHTKTITTTESVSFADSLYSD